MSDAPFYWIGNPTPDLPLLLTVPHSGEWVPPSAAWLLELPRRVLLTDIDRYVHELYGPACERLGLPLLCTRVHRYAVDLNRFPEDIDQDSVQGAQASSGTFSSGFHWVKTTHGDRLMDVPISATLHQTLTQEFHDAFHEQIAEMRKSFRDRFQGRVIYHLDCHSMPSRGGPAHRDPGAPRAQVCVSDVKGKSASSSFKELVVSSLEFENFQVAENWPYFGGRITERYGEPNKGSETIQIELNRSLYMNEKTKEKLPDFEETTNRLTRALARIKQGLTPK